MKRAFDMALSGVGLLLSSPLWVLFGLAIKLEDGGPIFYSQERVGFGGRNFEALKFRSMRTDAESGVGAVQAVEDDPRVTRIGRFMRKTAMDELPQLWNIFRGDMSFVGPRALRPGEIEASGSELGTDSCSSIRFPAMPPARRCARASPASRRSTRRAMFRAGRSSATTVSTCAGSRCRSICV